VKAIGADFNYTLEPLVAAIKSPDGSRKAFKLKDKPPRPIGVAPNQPSPHAGKATRYWKAFLAFVVGAIVVHAGLSALHTGPSTVPVPFEVKSGERAQVVSQPFRLGGALSGPVMVRTTSNVIDTWLNVDMTLTNVDSGRAFEIKRAMGFTKVGAIVDGSSDDIGEIHSVPPGKYTLAIDARSGALAEGTARTFKGNVTAYRSRLGWSNFWIFMIAIGIWPFIAWRRERSFEAQRWSESDYADEVSSGDDDDD